MLITKSNRKRIRTVIPVTQEMTLHKNGNAAYLSIPKVFVKSLGWQVGKTTVKQTLNQDGTLTLEAVPSKKTIGEPSPLPLFKKD